MLLFKFRLKINAKCYYPFKKIDSQMKSKIIGYSFLSLLYLLFAIYLKAEKVNDIYKLFTSLIGLLILNMYLFNFVLYFKNILSKGCIKFKSIRCSKAVNIMNGLVVAMFIFLLFFIVILTIDTFFNYLDLVFIYYFSLYIYILMFTIWAIHFETVVLFDENKYITCGYSIDYKDIENIKILKKQTMINECLYTCQLTLNDGKLAFDKLLEYEYNYLNSKLNIS